MLGAMEIYRDMVKHLQHLEKPVFAVFDKPNNITWSADDVDKMDYYDESWESNYFSIEELLVTELPIGVQRNFLKRSKVSIRLSTGEAILFRHV